MAGRKMDRCGPRSVWVESKNLMKVQQLRRSESWKKKPVLKSNA